MKKIILLSILFFSSASMANYAHIYFPNGSLVLIFNNNESELLSHPHKMTFPKKIILNADTLSECGFKDLLEVKKELNINALNAFFNSEKTLHAIAVIRSSSEYQDLSSYKNPNESHLIINEKRFLP